MSFHYYILLSLFLILELGEADITRGFQDTCSSSRRKDPCNKSAGLVCVKGQCLCLHPDIQVYIKEVGTCVVKAGRRCGKENVDDAKLEDVVGGDNPCIPNAECRLLKLRKWCRCKEGFYPNSNGSRCDPVEVEMHGNPCTSTADCDKSSGTECVDGKCLCPFAPTQQFYDEGMKKCVSYANGNCTSPKVSSCVKNAECLSVQLRTGFMSEEGIQKVRTSNVAQCHCVKGYSETKKGFCLPGPGTSCHHKNQPCNAENYLVCVDGKCGCRNPLFESVDEDTGKCVRLVGSSCKVDEMHCVQNSLCDSEKCVCKPGFVTTKTKTCLLNYGEECEPHQCHKGGGLACIDGKCQCFDSTLTFDNSTDACVAISSSVISNVDSSSTDSE